MTTVNKTIPSKEDLRKVPANETVEATIVDVDVKSWRELIENPDTLAKFKDPEALQLIVKYDAKGFIREEKFFYSEKPTTTSKLGRFLLRYDTPEVAKKIMVDFDSEGKSEILLAK